jgi:hypothetical protein
VTGRDRVLGDHDSGVTELVHYLAQQAQQLTAALESAQLSVIVGGGRVRTSAANASA